MKSPLIVKWVTLLVTAGIVYGACRWLGGCLAGALAGELATESVQVPDAVNYNGLCRWSCPDDVPRVACSWNERDANLVRCNELDPVTGYWIEGAMVMATPLGTSTAGILDCLLFGGPAEPFLRWNPTNDCCIGFDLDQDGDVDLRDFAVWQRRAAR